MPELAEAEFYRKRWHQAAAGRRVTAVLTHDRAKVFRGTDAAALRQTLTGKRYLGSEAAAKQILFRFSGGAWLGIHLGMSGELRAAPPAYVPRRHDHLVLQTSRCALIFTDPRMFGRVQFHQGAAPPAWWTRIAPPILSSAFTAAAVAAFLQRRSRAPLKAVLLMQERFPGVGNWMADEILWRARVNPRLLCGKLSAKQIAALWQETREVCRITLETVGVDFSDPPADWFYHQRWTNDGFCPRDGLALKTAAIGGRTTRWCPRCQR